MYVPKIAIVTTHGRKELTAPPQERLIDTLKRNGVPWSATAIYGLGRHSDTNIELLSALDRTLASLSEYSEILIYFNRNINPFLFSIDDFNVLNPEDMSGLGTEYFYQVFDNESGTTSATLAKLSPDDCRNLVAERVLEVVREQVTPAASIVVGVSGGGDSNAMLYGLSKAVKEAGVRVHPVIAKGIPDWDAGVPRAIELCENYGLDLKVLEECEIREMLGISSDGVSLIDRFEKEFPGDDFEFLGTLIIRLALSKYASELGTKYICTGLNLEDVVCEQIYRLSAGMKPAGMPARQIGDKTLIMPLWLCPKRIIDGCFPKYSLDNYEARYPCFSLGRNLYYSVVYQIQSSFPNYIEGMAQGFSKLAQRDPVEYTYDEGLGIHMERFVPLALRQRFLRMLGGRIETG